MSYYEVLGVGPDADTESVEKAYRTQVKQYHPDTADIADASAKFRDVKTAYEVLDTQRSTYDAHRHAEFVHHHGTPLNYVWADGSPKRARSPSSDPHTSQRTATRAQQHSHRSTSDTFVDRAAQARRTRHQRQTAKRETTTSRRTLWQAMTNSPLSKIRSSELSVSRRQLLATLGLGATSAALFSRAMPGSPTAPRSALRTWSIASDEVPITHLHTTSAGVAAIAQDGSAGWLPGGELETEYQFPTPVVDVAHVSGTTYVYTGPSMVAMVDLAAGVEHWRVELSPPPTDEIQYGPPQVLTTDATVTAFWPARNARHTAYTRLAAADGTVIPPATATDRWWDVIGTHAYDGYVASGPILFLGPQTLTTIPRDPTSDTPPETVFTADQPVIPKALSAIPVRGQNRVYVVAGSFFDRRLWALDLAAPPDGWQVELAGLTAHSTIAPSSSRVIVTTDAGIQTVSTDGALQQRLSTTTQPTHVVQVPATNTIATVLPPTDSAPPRLVYHRLDQAEPHSETRLSGLPTTLAATHRHTFIGRSDGAVSVVSLPANR